MRAPRARCSLSTAIAASNKVGKPAEAADGHPKICPMLAVTSLTPETTKPTLMPLSRR